MAQDMTDSPGATSESEWLSTEAAARRLGVNPRTIYNFINEGDLKAYRFGRVIRLKSVDVAAFEEACQIQPGTLAHLVQE
ncbi:MAG: helix-turn-helix domain-containing protein [Acidimicrobiia bacterium]|nr:helix-turn-helix domain-containing protein [Acidimicrobiia bacterium]MBL6927154.1 helix-turn-helix domain-containing protein [Acidimicrobiia bacterium]